MGNQEMKALTLGSSRSKSLSKKDSFSSRWDLEGGLRHSHSFSGRGTNNRPEQEVPALPALNGNEDPAHNGNEVPALNGNVVHVPAVNGNEVHVPAVNGNGPDITLTEPGRRRNPERKSSIKDDLKDAESQISKVPELQKQYFWDVVKFTACYNAICFLPGGLFSCWEKRSVSGSDISGGFLIAFLYAALTLSAFAGVSMIYVLLVRNRNREKGMGVSKIKRSLRYLCRPVRKESSDAPMISEDEYDHAVLSLIEISLESADIDTSVLWEWRIVGSFVVAVSLLILIVGYSGYK